MQKNEGSDELTFFFAVVADDDEIVGESRHGWGSCVTYLRWHHIPVGDSIRCSIFSTVFDWTLIIAAKNDIFNCKFQVPEMWRQKILTLWNYLNFLTNSKSTTRSTCWILYHKIIRSDKDIWVSKFNVTLENIFMTELHIGSYYIWKTCQ